MKLAVFLLAGGGIRLKPYTNDIPKCLVEVNGKQLLIRMLDHLDRGGIQKVILVIGYKGDKIIEAVGEKWKNMEIEYVKNADWATTNNVVSFNLATSLINEDFILLEGDLIFTWEAFKQLLEPNRIAVAKYQNHMNGTMVAINKDGIIKQFVMENGLQKYEKSKLYKTVNLYSFQYNYFKELVEPQLNRLVQSGQKQVYYEQAIANAVAESDYLITAANFDASPWYEIDTEEDLIKAREIFKDTEV